MNDYQYNGKIDFVQLFRGTTWLIIKGSDGNSYAFRKEELPKSQMSKAYKGKGIAFNCEVGKKIGYEGRLV